MENFRSFVSRRIVEVLAEVHSDGRIVESEIFREVVYTREEVGVELEDWKELVKSQLSIPVKSNRVENSPSVP